jgi:hypothetical protein
MKDGRMAWRKKEGQRQAYALGSRKDLALYKQY